MFQLAVVLLARRLQIFALALLIFVAVPNLLVLPLLDQELVCRLLCALLKEENPILAIAWDLLTYNAV